MTVYNLCSTDNSDIEENKKAHINLIIIEHADSILDNHRQSLWFLIYCCLRPIYFSGLIKIKLKLAQNRTR